ncbi:sugar phosphate isomerase/epimerase family protein [Clavibacter michiganensis]|uniref:sugar phosphate isomerase/epimerase family protein n=1 Tax=Clavibacter michiganensis TaxID=28447 RepID=UPI001BE125EA|nr:sugar phosphate isomerase/epimerase family protein [Clavibacter michiganensis]MBT1635010.1 sugar phosphate isomerase/epimerase [Clavibacter michiganensis]
MRFGVSSYTFAPALEAGTLTVPDVVDLVADSDAAHLEISIAGLGSELVDDSELVAAIRARADARGVVLANYAVGADLRGPDLDGEVARLHEHLRVAHELGIPLLRHDVFAWGWREADDAEFERALATIVPVCRALADHAATLGIATTVENHGMSMNASDRVLRLVEAVDRPAFRVTLDVGNSLCVDEDPLDAVPRLLPHAAVVHLKDFDVRDVPPDDTWMTTLGGRGIRGAVVGSGDLPLGELLGLVAASGFDGPVSIEFEGLEDPMTGFTQGLAAAQRLAAEAVR